MKAIDILRTVSKGTIIIIRIKLFGMRFESRRDAEALIREYDGELREDIKPLLDQEVSKMYPHDLALVLDLRQEEVI